MCQGELVNESNYMIINMLYQKNGTGEYVYIFDFLAPVKLKDQEDSEVGQQLFLLRGEFRCNIEEHQSQKLQASKFIERRIF